MTTFIQDLISRMSDNSYREREVKSDFYLFESDKTVSWAAYEEARLLSDSDYFEELFDIVDKTESTDIKSKAYFIIGHNAKNTNNLRATEYLLRRLYVEKENTLIVSILERIAEVYKPCEIDTSQIYKFTESRNWQIRGAAFVALTNNENKVEDFLINKLVTTDKKDDLRSLLSAISFVGTAKAIPYVEKNLKNRQSFIKSYSINVLTVIMLREGFSTQYIQSKLGVSCDFVLTHLERLDTLTRPG